MKRNPMQTNFVAGTSRSTRRRTTLLARMDDLQRGERIKTLREALHLTQPVVADRVGVTLRAYQEWEAGGGIRWENAERLGQVLDSTPDYIMSGRPEAPDMADMLGDPVAARLAALEDHFVQLNAKLDRMMPGPEPDVQPATAEQILDEAKRATRAIEQLLGKIGRDVGRRDLQSRRAEDRKEEAPPTAA